MRSLRKLRSNRSFDTDVLSAGFAGLLSAGHLYATAHMTYSRKIVLHTPNGLSGRVEEVARHEVLLSSRLVRRRARVGARDGATK